MAVDSFILFKNSKGTAIAGETTDDKHQQPSPWSEVLAWSTAANQPHTLSSATGGAGGGKVALGDFSFTKYLDSATDDLLQAMYNGEHLQSVQLEVRQAGGEAGTNTPQLAFLIINMAEVFITNYSISWGSERPVESWSLAYGQFGLNYKAQKTTGDESGAQPVGWDQITNKPWSPPAPT
jgi:type VI secretion system secreted protein Hcp